MQSRLQWFVDKSVSTLFLLIIFFLPTQLGKHFWPAFAIVRGSRIDYLSPTLYVTDLLIFLLICLWCLAGRLRKKKKRSGYSLPLPDAYIQYTVLFVGMVGLSILSAKEPLASVYGIVKIVELAFFGYITSHLLQEKKLFACMVVVFAFSMFFQSLLAMFQFYNHGSLGGLLYFLGERTFSSDTPGIANASVNGTLVLRPYGTLPHPNVLAGYLVVGVIMVTASIFTKSGSVSDQKRQISFVEKILYGIVLVISILTLLLSFSRVAILVLGICALGYGISVINSRFSKHRQSVFGTIGFVNHQVGYLFTALVLVLATMLFVPSLSERFLGSSLVEESFRERVELGGVALAMVKEHLFVGVGINNFIIRLPDYQGPVGETVLLQPVHNIFLLAAAEMGLIGLLGLIMFLWKTIIHIFRINNARLHQWNNSEFLEIQVSKSLLIVLLLVVLSLGMFDHYFLTLQQGQLLLALILGMCWVDFRIPPRKKLAKKA